MMISSSAPAIWIRQSTGQNVESRMNSVSTVTNPGFESRSQAARRASFVVMISMNRSITDPAAAVAGDDITEMILSIALVGLFHAEAAIIDKFNSRRLQRLLDGQHGCVG